MNIMEERGKKYTNPLKRIREVVLLCLKDPIFIQRFDVRINLFPFATFIKKV